METPDEFYIGWEAKAAPHIARTVRRAVIGLAAAAALATIVLAAAQRTIGVGVFEWGNLKEFSGVLKAAPYPHLLVRRPGGQPGVGAWSTYYLVKPFKFGLDGEIARRFDGRTVSLRGTLIYRENQTMIEAIPDSIKETTGPAGQAGTVLPEQPLSLGRQTLEGEIVDSKCYLGVMNPGNLTAHRACAIRCISGGIPPVLLVRETNGTATYFLLVSAGGKPVNQQVLDMVTRPVRITGEVQRLDGLLVLRADPSSYVLFTGH
jgi:hypothetical protein